VAPFRLGAGNEEALIEAVSNHAARTAPASFGPLTVLPLGNFVALSPLLPADGVRRLANEYVKLPHF
jgi:hypothetical protein